MTKSKATATRGAPPVTLVVYLIRLAEQLISVAHTVTRLAEFVWEINDRVARLEGLDPPAADPPRLLH